MFSQAAYNEKETLLKADATKSLFYHNNNDYNRWLVSRIGWFQIRCKGGKTLAVRKRAEKRQAKRGVHKAAATVWHDATNVSDIVVSTLWSRVWQTNPCSWMPLQKPWHLPKSSHNLLQTNWPSKNKHGSTLIKIHYPVLVLSLSNRQAGGVAAAPAASLFFWSSL